MKQEILEKVLNARKNLIIQGDVASGKTTNVLFPIVDNAIKNNESLFILDSKEEYINKYYKKLKEKNYNTIIINLRDLGKSDGWNPLEYAYNLSKNGDSDKAQEYLEKIGKIVFYEGSSQDPFWSITASDFFTGVTLGLFEDGQKDEINFNSINAMFDGIDKKYGATDFITTYFRSKDTASKPYVFASSTFLAPKETKGSILSVARQKLRLLVSREKLSQLLSKTTFNFEDVAEKPTAIIFIARDENKTLNCLAAMFIEQLYSILLEKRHENKFNFILDNFDIIEKCNDLVDIISSSPSRNIKFSIATRSNVKLASEYGDYVISLCDMIDIHDDKISVVINKVKTDVNNEFETVVISDEKIDYPKLNTGQLKIFNLEKKVQEIKSKELANSDFGGLTLPDFPNTSGLNTGLKPIDELISDIDDKIAQIELEQQMDSSKENEVKSELDDFKFE